MVLNSFEMEIRPNLSRHIKSDDGHGRPGGCSVVARRIVGCRAEAQNGKTALVGLAVGVGVSLPERHQARQGSLRADTGRASRGERELGAGLGDGR